MRIYKQYRWYPPKELCVGKNKTVMIPLVHLKEYYWMIQLENKYILNFVFGWKLKKNTEVSATFKSYRRWFKEKWFKN